MIWGNWNVEWYGNNWWFEGTEKCSGVGIIDDFRELESGVDDYFCGSCTVFQNFLSKLFYFF